MKRFATMMVGLALMVAPSSAFAQVTSQCQTYGSQTCNVTTDAPTGSLPFTGLNAGLMVVVGGGLLGAGFAVRRLSRHTG